MKERNAVLILMLALTVIGVAAGQNLVHAGPDQAIRSDETIPAFPGAEGFGKWSQGGWGGDVYVVTNLNDSGPGSLRKGVEAGGPRTVVFEVSGTIFLDDFLIITNPHITIAGQTAPGDGICVAGYPLIIEAEHSIIRYIRCRLGDNEDCGSADSISIRSDNVIIDHCSASWSVDEVLNTYMDPSGSSWPDKVTLQWTIVAEALRNSDIKSEPHSMGSLLRGSIKDGFEFMEKFLEAYEEIRPNLVQHSAGYPTANYLRQCVARG